MSAAFFDRVKMSVTGTPGTGAVTLGSAQSGFQSYAGAGGVDGQTSTWLFTDGTAWEVSSCVYTASGTSLARTLMFSSTGSLISLTSAAIAGVVASARNIANAEALTTMLFGDGSDGNVTVAGSVTLTRDMYYNNLTISAGAVLNTASWRIFVAGTLDLTAAPAGSIVNNGNAGAAATTTGGVAGTGLSTGHWGIAPTNGGTGTSSGTGVGGGGGGLGSSITFAGIGGASAAGGAGSPNAGGSGASAPGLAYQGIDLSALTVFAGTAGAVAVYARWGGSGPGGAAGGGDGTNKGGSGGGGGQGAGPVWIAAAIISRGGSTAASAIQAKGANGGAGFTPTVGNAGGGGGGGGSGGGFIGILAGRLIGSAAANVLDVTGGNGGDGGNGFGTGVGGDGASSGQGGRIMIWNLALGSFSTVSPVASVAGAAHSGITHGAGATATTSRASL